MAHPKLEKMVWDDVAVGDTRPAMAGGGVPFWWLLAIFFGPSVVVVLTFNPMWLCAIPVLWVAVKWAYLGNPNRPFEWWLWITSGGALADWHEWGGASHDAHGKPDRWSGLS